MRGVYLLMAGTTLLLGCQKDEPCLPPRAEINGTERLYAGQTLSLQAVFVDGAVYNWKGPNGFAATGDKVTIPNVSSAVGGAYTLTVKVGTCENSAAKDVAVLPSPSCSPANNTVVLTNNLSFTDGRVRRDAYYEVQFTGSRGDCKLTFAVDPLVQGNRVYNLSPSASGSSSVAVQVDMSGIYSNWHSQSGKLHVMINNGTVTATFCSAPFSNLQGASNQNGSGRLTWQ